MIGELWDFITFFFRFIGVHKMNAKRAALINTIVHVVFFTESSGQFLVFITYSGGSENTHRPGDMLQAFRLRNVVIISVAPGK
jgi:hypothetical protein